ncbi:peptidoglycan DD-metalloendopeptidase family protein [Oceanobacillus profundus]|uniref:peptidoglycan DD-metalloendopeptidase family protein n=1 Tax=Oceanobacillus profundus TaxID=372463 RepID=UPI002692277E
MLYRTSEEKKQEAMKHKRKWGFLSKTAIMTCLGVGISLNPVQAEDTLETIYHVYIDGEHLGKVDDQDVIQQVIDDKLAKHQNNYDAIELTIGEDITFIPEMVFNPKYNNEKVTKKLDEQMTVMADAVELNIANETVGYFKDEETAEAVLKAYTTKYVDENEWEKIEAIKQKSAADKGTKEKQKQDKGVPDVGETIVTDIAFSKEAVISEETADPDEILTEKQGIQMLEKGTLQDKIHAVKEGEVLGEIAGKYDLTTEELLELNPDLTDETVLKIDQEINVTEYDAFAQVVVTEKQAVEESIPFKTEVIESEDMYKGEEKVKQEGKDGKKEVLYEIKKQNGKQTAKESLDEAVTEEPINKVVIKGTKVISSRGTGDMVWPAVGGYISSHLGERWGRMHKGIDIARPSNRNILAADNGVIESADYNDGGYGNKIVMNHNNGMKTIYAHLSSIDVEVGQVVEKGSKIGVMGSTGNSTGIHLHFEVYKNGSLKNPTEYVSE